MNKVELQNWLIKNKKLLSIRALEQEVQCPPDTLRKFLSGKQGLPDKWVFAIRKAVLNLIEVPSSNALQMSFGTKQENNARRTAAFLELTPSERLQWFYKQLAYAKPKEQNKGNFILTKGNV